MGFKYFYTNNDNLNSIDNSVISYMSPELLSLSKHDTKTDIWSYGCVTCEILAGFKAFDDESTKALIKKIKIEPLPEIKGNKYTVLLIKK